MVFQGHSVKNGTGARHITKNSGKSIYFANFIVTDPGNTEFAYKEILTENQYREAKDNPANKFKAAMGAEAIKELLMNIDLDELSKESQGKAGFCYRTEEDKDSKTSGSSGSSTYIY